MEQGIAAPVLSCNIYKKHKKVNQFKLVGFFYYKEKEHEKAFCTGSGAGHGAEPGRLRRQEGRQRRCDR